MATPFDVLVARFDAGLDLVQTTLAHQGYLHAKSKRDPSYCLLLTTNMDGESLWRVTSFRHHQPLGHRPYDLLDEGAPTQNALQEFVSEDWRLLPVMRPNQSQQWKRLARAHRYVRNP